MGEGERLNLKRRARVTKRERRGGGERNRQRGKR